MITNLENWTELTRGLYRYVIADSACYEIHVIRHDHKDDILDADAHLFAVGEWCESGSVVFDREFIHAGSVAECLTISAEGV